VDPTVQRLTDCLAAGRRIVAKGLNKRAQGIAYLQEGLSIASALKLEEAWVIAASDLAMLLLQPQRVKVEDRLMAFGLLARAITIARRSPLLLTANLGRLLTTRAEARMRGGRGREVLNLAREDLEEALPLREDGLDKAFTLAGLGRVFHLMPVEIAQEQLKLWDEAQTYYQTVLPIFRASADSYNYGLVAVNLSELYCRSWSLKQRLSVWDMVTPDGLPNSVSVPLTQLNLAYQALSAAGANPSLFDLGSDVRDMSFNMRPVVADARTRAEVAELLGTIDDAQRGLVQAGWASMWGQLQYWKTCLRHDVLAHDPVDLAADIQLALDYCSKELDPELWCKWSTVAMDLWARLTDYSKAAEVGLQAVDAFKLALLSAPEVLDERELVQEYHYVGRRTAFLLLERDRLAEAIGVLQSARGYSRNRSTVFSSIEDVTVMSSKVNAAVLYLVVGPECTHALIMDGRGGQTRLLHDRVEWVGGNKLIPLLTRISLDTPGLLPAQTGDTKLMQASLDFVFRGLQPLMTHLHHWLVDAGITDLALIPTGPYSLLPFSAVPVEINGHNVPFGSLHRCTTVPSAYKFRPVRGPLLRSILIAGEPVRPDLEPLHTRRECEGIRNTCQNAGWAVSMLLFDKASRNRIAEGSSRSSIVHFAGHARTDIVDPSNTVVSLSDGDVPLEDFGALIPGSLQLLVLSACQTGQFSLFGAPDENFGLAAMAIDAGVRLVVGSLWPVGDSATVRFMKNFYKALVGYIDRDGEMSAFNVADALGYAQRSHGSSGGGQNPDYGESRHWAAFQVFGL